MRTLTAMTLGFYLTVATLSGVFRADAGKESTDDPILALIKQLGDEKYLNREAAMRALEAKGESALTALAEAASKSEDPEIQRRARRLVIKLLPDFKESKSTSLKMAAIRPQSYEMGSPLGEPNRRLDETQHQVQITKPYFIGLYEVTQGEYQQVMKSNPSWFSSKGEGSNKVTGTDTTSFPVENVSWFDTIDFCNRLSKLDGLRPYYKIESLTREKGSIVKAKVTIVDGNGYRLPTEAEWELACRAGTNTAFHFGPAAKAGDANLKSILVAGGYGSYPKWKDLERTAAKGSYRVNLWGLHDLHGNVAEWCWDWYDKDYYTNSPVKDPLGPATGTHRVLRGGSWLVTETSSRSASRFSHVPGERKYYAGFRVVRNP